MKHQLLIALTTTATFTLVGCQTLSNATSSAKKNANSVLDVKQHQSKSVLSLAIKNTLYQNQNWIAEQQVYLEKSEKKPLSAELGDLEKMTECQDLHDRAFIERMKADNITDYTQIDNLSEEKKAFYDNIKQTYQKCYEEAKETFFSNESNIATMGMGTSPEDYDLVNILTGFGLSESQLNSLNNFVSKSGKMVVTGIYRPSDKQLVVQFDAGFENKNLKYHYRLPIVADWKQQAIYVKPDIFIPMVAIHLDNKLGMSWKDKWYKFDKPKNQKVPSDITAKAWLNAIKDGFDALPDSQFSIVNAENLNPKITNISQKLDKSGVIIHWKQSAKDQSNLYQDVINNFIYQVDEAIAKDQSLQRADNQQAWQIYKDKLTKNLEEKLIAEFETPTQFTGQDIYFVLDNQKIKQIYVENQVSVLKQPIQINTWLTFDPDLQLVAQANRPDTLQQLTKTIYDDNSEKSNIINGIEEMKRIKDLDNSRRLFGQKSDFIELIDSYYKYVNDSKQAERCQTLYDNLKETKCLVDKTAKKCDDSADFKDFQKYCENFEPTTKTSDKLIENK